MILVTGAAGFIGSNLVFALNELGCDDIVVCDWLADDGRWRNLGKRCFRDFQLPEQLPDFLSSAEARRVTLVLHMGAVSETTAHNGNLIIQRNYQFTKMLWRWCAENGATFVYASSAATYGDGTAGFDDAMDLVGLKTLRPLNLYGWSKHIFDLYAMGDVEARPQFWYGLKFFNVFGPNEYHKGDMRSVICKMAPNIIAGKPVELFKSYKEGFSDGAQLRDFIHVDDICKGVLHLARSKAPSGLYNIGTGKARSFADMVNAAYRAVGNDPKIVYVPMPEALRGRYQYFTQAQTTKLRSTGLNDGFDDLEASVESYLRDYLVKEDAYR